MAKAKRKRTVPPWEYHSYVKSEAWCEVKSRYWKSRLPKKCQGCGKKGGLDLHHRTYSRLGCEYLTDLVPLCRSCHDEVHFEYDRRGKKYLWKVTKRTSRRLRKENGVFRGKQPKRKKRRT